MNWGQRLNKFITRNWREKIISLLLAFLFWFMLKAQDVRHTPPYMMPQPAQMMPPQSSAAPSQLAPVLPQPSVAPSQLVPMVPAPTAVPPLADPAGGGVRAAAGAGGL